MYLFTETKNPFYPIALLETSDILMKFLNALKYGTEFDVWKYPSFAQATWHFLKVGAQPGWQDKLAPLRTTYFSASLMLLI